MDKRSGYIGLKDFFTLINALGGVGAIVLTVFGLPQFGVVSIFLGFIFGDALDGFVARKTGTANKFGAEFDSASDQLSQGIAPAVVVAGYFAQHGKLVLGGLVSGFVALVAVVRVARFATATFPTGSAYCGLPRVGVGILAAGLPFSYLGQTHLSPWSIAVILTMIASLSLVPIPYGSHKGRKIPRYALVGFVTFLLGCVVTVVYNWTYLIDFVVMGFSVYVLLGWLPVHKDDKEKFFNDYKKWTKALTAKS